MSWFADGMAPCVTGSSVPMRLIMQNREVLVYYEEEIQLPVSCVLSKKKEKKIKNRSVNVMVADGVAPYVAGPSAPMFDYVR